MFVVFCNEISIQVNRDVSVSGCMYVPIGRFVSNFLHMCRLSALFQYIPHKSICRMWP